MGYSLAGLFSLWAGVTQAGVSQPGAPHVDAPLQPGISQPGTPQQVARGCQPDDALSQPGPSSQPGTPQQVARCCQPDNTPVAIFQRIGAVSGSFWFPGLLDYVDQQLNRGVIGLTHAYLSLGDREARTPNPQIMHVRENAEFLASKLESAGIISTFELNRGNHFQNVEGRMQKALDWLVK